MSRKDLVRFTDDFQNDLSLSDEFLSLGDDAAAWQALASEKGYELSFEEAESLIESYSELGDDELENVAGGWDGSGGGG